MPTALVKATAEGYADGAAVDLANGGDTPITAIVTGTNGSIIARATSSMPGNREYEITPASDATSTHMRWSLSTDPGVRGNLNSVSFYLQMPTAPSNAQQFLKFASASGATTYCGVGIDQNGKLLVVDAAGSASGRVAATAVPAAVRADGLRLEVGLDNGVGGTGGVGDFCYVKAYDMAGVRLPSAQEPPAIGSNFGTPVITSFMFGKAGAGATTWPKFDIDHIQIAPNTLDEFGPYVEEVVVVKKTKWYVARSGGLVEIDKMYGRAEMPI